MELMEVLARSRGLGELLGVDDGFNDCALGGADMVRGVCRAVPVLLADVKKQGGRRRKERSDFRRHFLLRVRRRIHY
jgi:hypothetical protein